MNIFQFSLFFSSKFSVASNAIFGRFCYSPRTFRIVHVSRREADRELLGGYLYWKMGDPAINVSSLS